jgi:hypothetical protein
MPPSPSALDATEKLDVDAEASSTALIVAVARGAPAPNEPTSSADEAEDEAQDDEWIWVGNQRRRVVAPPVRIGGWAVIHGLRNERVLNGLLVRCCPDKPEDPDDSDRVRVELVEESQRGQQKRVRRLNLQGVGPEEAIGRLLIAWLESGPSTQVFAVPAWAALAHDEALRKTERALMHNMCVHMCDERGVAVVKLLSDERSAPRDDPNRQVRLQLAGPVGTLGGVETAALPTTALDVSVGDLRQMRFAELCALLEALEAVDETQKGFLERRKQVMERFWRGPPPPPTPTTTTTTTTTTPRPTPPPPRHLRTNLFDVMRLLLPHNDSRRYYLGTGGVARAIGLALG